VQPRRQELLNGRLIQEGMLAAELCAHQSDPRFVQVKGDAKALGFGLKMFHLKSIAHLTSARGATRVVATGLEHVVGESRSERWR
jgi:hypothetical protein